MHPLILLFVGGYAMKYEISEILKTFSLTDDPQNYKIHAFTNSGQKYKVAIVGDCVFQIKTAEFEGNYYEYFVVPFAAADYGDDIFARFYATIAIYEGLFDDILKIGDNLSVLYVFLDESQKERARFVNMGLINMYGLEPSKIKASIHTTTPGFITNVNGLIAPEDRIDMAKRYESFKDLYKDIESLNNSPDYELDFSVLYNEERPDIKLATLEDLKTQIVSSLNGSF